MQASELIWLAVAFGSGAVTGGVLVYVLGLRALLREFLRLRAAWKGAADRGRGFFNRRQ